MTGRARDIRIVYDENSVHNEIIITGNDPELFIWGDPETLYGQPRIDAVVGNRTMQFIIESRQGELTDFTISGLSVSVKEDLPYASEIDFHLDTPTLASEIAASLTTYCPVDWQADDWVVPTSFTFTGTPLRGVMRLAEEVGAIVRCQDDGSLLVRKRRPVRPVDMPLVKADVSYDRSSIIVLNHAEEVGSGYNAVKIIGHMPDAFIPEIQVEPIVSGDSTRGPAIGEACYVRVYWAGNEPRVVDTYVTDGIITPVGGGIFYTDTEEELIDFMGGTANVKLPVFSLTSCQWIGDDGGEVAHTPYSKELSIGQGKFRVARVKYVTRFKRYLLENHNVERLIAALFLMVEPGVLVTVRTADDPVYGTTIDASLLSSEHVAVARGKAWIDQQYRKSICNLTVPYDDAAIDGKIAFIDDPHIDSPGNYHIVRAEIVMEGPQTTNQLQVEKCLISFNS
jgi:hypothetical protein